MARPLQSRMATLLHPVEAELHDLRAAVDRAASVAPSVDASAAGGSPLRPSAVTETSHQTP